MIINFALEDDPQPTPEDFYTERMRKYRNQFLADSDWTQTADNPTGNAEAWATYRQALRDFPATWTPDPEANFPDPPEAN